MPQCDANSIPHCDAMIHKIYTIWCTDFTKHIVSLVDESTWKVFQASSNVSSLRSKEHHPGSTQAISLM